MATETFVVAYENKEGDDGLLDYAIARAKKDNAALLLVHILEWSPYKFLTPQELEERHGRRKEELKRAQEVILDPAMAKVKDAGLEVDCRIRYGSVVELVAEIATEAEASMIIVGRSGTQSMTARIFGSVPLGLAQIATVPTVIVP
ncbi:universal stress protein [Salipiger sp. CCB-MM3]|uniref:universal stress protein n=1 Tax=Roseobacteraceae TaxID=2854170 RepID=UPI00080AB1C2|nr:MULTISPECIES: universal stress protein [Roseobacteraceae]ANT60201.1 universal stress protein [Salipiger sp. CCB-MM3]MCA0995321.1 universal stress protein [Alloyangia pacifica]